MSVELPVDVHPAESCGSVFSSPTCPGGCEKPSESYLSLMMQVLPGAEQVGVRVRALLPLGKHTLRITSDTDSDGERLSSTSSTSQPSGGFRLPTPRGQRLQHHFITCCKRDEHGGRDAKQSGPVAKRQALSDPSTGRSLTQ